VHIDARCSHGINADHLRRIAQPRDHGAPDEACGAGDQNPPRCVPKLMRSTASAPWNLPMAVRRR
jgi:hypothetical protein